MKISEYVVTGIITILGVTPFIWFTYIGKKASGKSKSVIKDLLKEESLDFHQKEFWNHNFIGIDEAKNSLLFIKIKSPENEIAKIDLNDVKSCKIQKSTRDYKRDKRMESELQTLDLQLVFESKRPTVDFNFYDIEDHLSEDFEMKRAEKWQQLILQNVMKNKTDIVAA
ncbi:MAG: hypothetical protein R2783_01545 [Gelidibacter sp.]